MIISVEIFDFSNFFCEFSQIQLNCVKISKNGLKNAENPKNSEISFLPKRPKFLARKWKPCTIKPIVWKYFN
jgi:hypothetical protein